MQQRVILHKQPLGRLDYLKFVVDTLVIKYLSHVSRKHLGNETPQLAIAAFDLVGNTLAVRGLYEKEQLETTLAWLRSEGRVRGSVIDAGANIGNHSVFFSKYFAHVYAFEPNPRTFQLLAINAQLASNVTPFNLGLSDGNRAAVLNTYKANIGASRITDQPGEGDGQRPIEVATLDSMLDQFQRPVGLIKMDVEGHELRVLKGAKNLIERDRPLVLFEQGKMDFTGGVSPVVELLREYGYAEFATVMPSPYLPPWFPRFLRAGATALVRMLCGYRFIISSQSEIRPDFYSFLIAIPRASARL